MQTNTYTTGSFDRYGPSNGYIFALELTETATDLIANTSCVSYRLYLRSGPDNRFQWELHSALSLDGRQVAARTENRYLDYNSEWLLLSGELTVPHDRQGRKTLDFTATLTPYEGGSRYSPPDMELTGSMELTVLERHSTIAATGAAIGDGATLAVGRKSALFTHSIRYEFGALSGYLADAAGRLTDTEEQLTATTLVFPIPESFYGQIPHSPTGLCHLTCVTYQDGEAIGDPQTTSFTVTADPSRCGPTLTAQAADVNPSTLALTGNEHVFVAGRSRVECAVDAQARWGASLSEIRVAGVKITQNPHIMEGVTTAEITVRAVDSRGYSAEYTIPGLSLVDYVPLSFFVSASRTDPTGGSGLLELSGKWYAGSFGLANNSLQAQYRVGSGPWLAFTPGTEAGDLWARLNLSGLDYRYAHTIEVQLRDSLDTVTKIATVSKGIPVFDWGENDFCFHVPVIFTATDGTRFSLDLSEGQLQIRRES